MLPLNVTGRVDSGAVRAVVRLATLFTGSLVVGAAGSVLVADALYRRAHAQRCGHLTAAQVAAAITEYRAGHPVLPTVGSPSERTGS